MSPKILIFSVIGISKPAIKLKTSLSEVMPSGAPSICCLPVLLKTGIKLPFSSY